MPKKLFLGLAAAVAAFSLAACGGDGDDAKDDAAQTEQQDGQAMPEPDLDNIPDVVAEVNGEDISGEEFSKNYESQFQQLAIQSQMTGEEPAQDDHMQQAVYVMINSELLVFEDADESYTASENDMDEYLDDMGEENGMDSYDDLMEEVENQGLDEDQIRQDVHNEVLMEQ